MLRERIYYILLVVVILLSQPVYSQLPQKDSVGSAAISNGSSNVTVGYITISGNKKTKSSIILREIPFKTGDKYTLDILIKKFEDARRQLMNSALFNSVMVAAKEITDSTVNVLVQVTERWYLFPVPYFKPVDRNLNQWIVEQKAKLNRVNYGAKLLYYNATGRNDKLKMWFITGYTKQISFGYDRLYIDKKLKWGINSGFSLGKNREINYNTVDNKQVFLKDNNSYLKNFVSANLGVTYRRAIKTRHHFGISYYKEDVKDTVLSLNKNYFKTITNQISFPTIYYRLEYTDLDYIPYPTKGYATDIAINKSGFNKAINVWELKVKGLGSWHLTKNIFMGLSAFGSIKLPFKQPFFNQRFLGYGDTFLQGYEYYVIDGVAGGYLKTTLNRKIVNFNIRVPQIKGKLPVYIPFRILGKIYGNMGYVHNPQPGLNFLSNKMLYSGGFGIDIVTLYDVIFKFEFTFNQLGQNGVFLHRKSIF